MRNVVLLLTALTSSQALAADPAIELGAHAGVIVFDGLDQLNTSWYLTPRLGFWFNRNVGLEVDVGLSTGAADVEGHGFLAVAPQLQFVGSPLAGKDKAPVLPIITFGAGVMYKSLDDAGVRGTDYASTRLEGLASFGTGLLVPIVGPLHFRTDLRMIVTGAPGTDQYRYPFIDFTWTAGFGVNLSVAKDADKDKIPDKKDACPSEAEDVDLFEDADGCPESDNDKDGVPDLSDACPNEAEDVDTFEDADGCPDPDNDRDSIPDVDDVCPLEAGTVETSGCPDADGDLIADADDACPEVAGLPQFSGCPDTDGDGLADPDDECPTEAGPETSFGCPDDDSDRVPNYRDACPTKPVPANVDPTQSDGCPAKVYVTADALQILDRVYFDTGKDTIQKKSFPLLDEIAAILVKYPAILKVQVEGHTDDVGDDAKNLTLSQARAESVVKYLSGKGVEASRLVAMGFGETKPIADNKTSAGKAENRRVAFTILEQAKRVLER